MTKEVRSPRIFDIDGQKVRCYELDGHRLWRCECAAFRKRLEKLGEGFCAHVAVAIERGISTGSIEF